MLMKNTKIVGAKFRGQEALEICRNLSVDEELALIPEPENPYDPNAIAVWARGQHVGYIPAYMAKVIRAAITPEAEATASVVAPGDNPEIFVTVQ